MSGCPAYRAEDRAWAAVDAFREQVADPQLWVDYVATREPFVSMRRKAGLPELCVTVLHGNRNQTACSLAWAREQHIALQAGVVPTQGLLLHELAHLCTPLEAAHDHRWVASYLTLVRTWLGELAAERLLRCMREERAFP